MSQIEYYSQDPLRNLPHRDALAAWGVTLIVFGCLSGLLALAVLGFSTISLAGLIPSSPSQDAGTLLVGAAVYAVGSAALIWLGIGSRLGRRWVRPFMVAGSAITLISGLASVVPLVSGMISIIFHPLPALPATPGISANVEVFMLAGTGCFMFLLMVILPLFLLWFYGRRTIKATLEQMDPQPRWTDHCQLPVFGWALACVLMGMSLMSLAAKGIVPFFTTVLVGAPAQVLIAGLALLFFIGGILCIRLSKRGWLMTFTATAFIASCNLTFAFAGDHQLYLDLMFERMHLPKATIALTARMSDNAWVPSSLIYGFAVGYVLWIWKRFRAPAVIEPTVTQGE